MTARRVVCDGFTALVVAPDDGGRPYLVPPVVLDDDGNVVMGHDVLAAIVESGMPAEVPVYQGLTPAQLAALDRAFAAIRTRLDLDSDVA